MHSEIPWLPLSMMGFAVLTMNLKGKPATLALGVYLWGMAASLGMTQWHDHQQWLADLARMHRADPQGRDTGGMIARHQEVVREGLAVEAAFLLTPFVFYWFDCRKARAAVKPVRAV